MIARSDLPHVKIDDAHGVSLDRVAHRLQNLIRRLAIYQHPTRTTQETPRPSGNQDPANDAHSWVHPGQADVFGRHQGGDCENRRQGIGKHVQVRGKKIVIVFVRTADVVMVVTVAQNDDADTVDQQSEHGNNNGLVVGEGHRMHKSIDALDDHQESEEGEHDCARESSERVELACTEAERGIVSSTTGKNVGKDRETECRRVRCHVQTVGEQSHRTEENAGGNLDRHHDGSHQYYPPSASFAAFWQVLIEMVLVLQVLLP